RPTISTGCTAPLVRSYHSAREPKRSSGMTVACPSLAPSSPRSARIIACSWSTSRCARARGSPPTRWIQPSGSAQPPSQPRPHHLERLLVVVDERHHPPQLRPRLAQRATPGKEVEQLVPQ